MCRSLEEGGRRCRCSTPEAAAEKRRKRNDAQKRYLARKAANAKPENPFANFTPEAAPLTAEQRDAERAKLEDFFARKRADPAAQWDAAPKTVDADENPFAGWVTGQPIP